MTSSKQEHQAHDSAHPTTPLTAQSGLERRVKESPASRIGQATKKVFRLTAKEEQEDKSVHKGIAILQLGLAGLEVPQDCRGNIIPNLVNLGEKALPALPQESHSPCMSIFPSNVAAPTLRTTLPHSGTRFEHTAQLAYSNYLLRTYLPSDIKALDDHDASLEPSQKAFIDSILQDEREQNRIRWLIVRVVEELVAENLKTSSIISEVILLGPFLDRESYRRLLNCLIVEFENATLMDIDLLQGLAQLVQCAEPDYLLSDDLVRILAVLRICLEDTHQQSVKHTYYLALALSTLLDVMVEGKVQDLRRVVDQESLLALLKGLSKTSDPYVKHQATYALQGLLHVPNDESHRQAVLRHTGNIAMGLLGVASVCKLDVNGFSGGAGRIYDATVNALDVGSNMVGGAQSILDSGQGLWASAKGGVLSGGRLLWYTALREAQEHIRNGRLADFSHLVSETPCRRDVEFLWGVCRLLGEISIDPRWEHAVRQRATDFLAELYRDNSLRHLDLDNGINRWILDILQQVSVLHDPITSGYTQRILLDLEKEGNIAQRNVYRDVRAGPPNTFPLLFRLPVPSSSTLLARVLAIPDVEYDLHRLKIQRLEEREHTLYIPPQGKPTLLSPDDTLFPLMEDALEFLSSHRQVLLLLGDSGAGKSTFNLMFERTLWKAYKAYGLIPLHISLPAIDNPAQDLIEKQLRYYNFSDAQIREMKLYREFAVICDGYDESQLKTNLYITNHFNLPGQWKVKLVVSCRSHYLDSNYRSRFQPTPATAPSRYDRNMTTATTCNDLFQEAVIAPFSKTQIEQYVEQHVSRSPARYLDQDGRPQWTKDDYMEKLIKIPNLIDLVSNPFLLSLALEALPGVAAAFEKDSSLIRIARVELFDGFARRWLEVNQARLEESPLNASERSEFDLLLEDGFLSHGIRFQKELAEAIFSEQAGYPVVRYTHLRDRDTWKAEFFSPDDQTKLLRESSTMTRSGGDYRFMHRSLLEYFYSRTIYDPLDYGDDSVVEGRRRPTRTLQAALGRRSIIDEPSVIQFLAERVEQDPSFRRQLLDIVEQSKTTTQAQVVQAAANAITILVRAGTRFNGADLRGIKVAGADLRGGQFDTANLEGADLSETHLSKTWLRQANLCKAVLTGAQFDELPYLQLEAEVLRCGFSSDGGMLVVSVKGSRIYVYDTTTWTNVANYPGGDAIAISPTSQELAKTKSGQDNTVELGDILVGGSRIVLPGHAGLIYCIAYSPDGDHIATASTDATIRIWSTLSGATLHSFGDHTSTVTGVAFSRTGFHLASCSFDKTVRTWDVQTGESLRILEGHTDAVETVIYSPDGSQIASGGADDTIRLWDANTGELCHTVTGHLSTVYGVAYSPDERRIASSSEDGTVRIWDSRTGEPLTTFSGHIVGVTSLEYSPAGDFIASGAWDGTVRLWKTGGDLLLLSDAYLDNDTNAGICFNISPDGERIFTGNEEGTVRILDASTGEPGQEWDLRKRGIEQIAVSPCGGKIACPSLDCTVRVWCASTGVSLQILRGHGEPTLDVAFSPSGSHIASGGKDRTVRVWSTESGGEAEVVMCGHSDNVNGVAYSPSGDRIASCSSDKTVRLWDSRTGEQLFVLDHCVELLHVTYSPGGQELAVVPLGSDQISFWDSRLGDHIVDQYKDINQQGIACAFSPIASGDSLLAVASRDGMLRIWDIASGGCTEVLRTLVGLVIEIKWRQTSSEDSGLSLATLGATGSMRVWRLVKAGEERSYVLQLVWGTGERQLMAIDANLEDIVGLSPVNLKLLKQRCEG